MTAATVWLLMGGEDHQGGHVLGLFATRELALPALQAAAETLPTGIVRTTHGEDESVHLHSDGDWISLTARPVVTQAGGR